jgi:hypothetical protein
MHNPFPVDVGSDGSRRTEARGIIDVWESEEDYNRFGVERLHRSSTNDAVVSAKERVTAGSAMAAGQAPRFRMSMASTRPLH